MDLYSTLNYLAPKISHLSRDNNLDPSKEDPMNFLSMEDPVYVLGNKYSSLYELDDIQLDIRSNIWMTYRRNFTPISDTGLTSDTGWGCMLRCGQMVLARAFLNFHLGRNWRWTYSDYKSLRKLSLDDENSKRNQDELHKYFLYRNILKLFADIKTATYSIHQIALMGVCEGKEVGQWFGPNTIAQVLRKLSTFDKMNDIYIYVSLDNIVFLDDIRKFCKSSKLSNKLGKGNNVNNEDDNIKCHESSWKPLILFLPLRLGLSEINPVYFRALKTTFTFPQTLGILGGRPNHALYFIGCCGDDLIYLDPHTTQQTVNFAQDRKDIEQMLEQDERGEFSNTSCFPADDVSYHCERAYRMSISLLDPSLSLCFFCKTEEEFNQWAHLTMGKLLHGEPQPLFEIMRTRPDDWPVDDTEFGSNGKYNINRCLQNNENRSSLQQENKETSPLTSDEEFEIIE